MDEKHEPDETIEDEVDDEIAAKTETLPSMEEEEPEGKMSRKNLVIFALALLLAAGLGIGWLALRSSGGSGTPRTAAQGQTGGRNAATAAPSTGKDGAPGDGKKEAGRSGKDAPSSDKKDDESPSKDGTSEDGKKDAGGTAAANPSTGPTAPGGTEGGSGSPGGGAAPSNPSSGSGTAAPSKKTCPDCGGSGTAQTGTSTVTNSAAWDEWVVDSAAWDEWVVDSAAWDEPVYEWRDRYVCYDDGAVFYPGEEGALSAHLDALVEAGYNGSSYVETYQVQVGTVHHDEVGHYVHHDEAGHYVHHDAITHTEPVYGTCPTCGGSGQV